MPLLDVFWAMLWFFLFIVWIWLIIAIFSDIFRSNLSGWAKALWGVFVVFIPIIGILAYLIVHGGDMRQRAVEQGEAGQRAEADYVASLSGDSSAADEVDKLAKLHRDGVLTDDEFAAQKQKALDG